MLLSIKFWAVSEMRVSPFSTMLGFVLGVLLTLTFLQIDRLRMEVRKDSRKDCVCGERAEKLSSKTGILFSSSPSSSSIASPTSLPANDKMLMEFLYPPNKTAILRYKDRRKQYQPGSHYEPTSLQDEYLFKKMIFVGVLTQQSYLPTRAKYLYDTWGKEVDKLVFFVGKDCVVPPDLSYLPIVKLEGIPDNVYPPLKKTFAVMDYMYNNYLDQFNWFIRADDDMYIRTRQLKELLSSMLPYQKVYLGRAGTGRKEDLERLYLLPHERYCMGGPGIILSMASLRELGPHLANCLNAVLLYSKTGYNDDDVEVGRCISRKINIQCSSSKESRYFFLFDYKGEALNPVTLWTTPSFRNLITIHPLKNPDNMLSVHHFYKTLDFEEDYESLHKMADYLNQVCKQLPPHVSPPLSVSAGCDLQLHPHLNKSSKLNHQGLALSGYLVHRKEVPFNLKPIDMFDVQFWTRFNDSSVQKMDAVSPEFSPQASFMAEVRHVLSMLRPYIRTHYAQQDVEIKHLMDGYTRFNPHLGREYILTLQLSVAGAYKYTRYHVVREIGPQVSVVDLPPVNPSPTVNVILPLEHVDGYFLEFLKSFGNIGLKYGPNIVHLVVVVFTAENADLAERTLRHFTAKTFPLSTSIATGAGDFNGLRAYDIGMATLQNPSSLAFLANVKLRFAPGFFRRCHSNPELGRRVYYPSAFWLYKSDHNHTADGAAPTIAAWTGQWAHYDFSLVCIYKKDYDTVGGYHNKKYSVDLFEAIAESQFDVMKAPEPGLFMLWGERHCRRLSSPRRRKICLNLKQRDQFEQVELADYLGGLGATENNFIYQKESLF